MRPGARVSEVVGRAVLRRALAAETATRDERQLALPLGIPVPSRSHEGEHYVVVDGRCTCAGFVYTGHCYHEAAADVEAIFGPPREGARP